MGRARHHDLGLRAALHHLPGHGAERGQQPADLLGPGPGQEPEDRAVRVGAEGCNRLPFAFPAALAVQQGVADKNGLNAEFSQKRLLLREDHGHAVGVAGQDPGPSGPPRPQLRRDVVEHRDAALVGLLAKPEVEAGIIDRDHQVRRLGHELALDAATQAEEEGEPRDNLGEPHDDQRVELYDGLDAGGDHAGTGESVQLRFGKNLEQGGGQRRRMQISGCLTRGKEDAGLRHANRYTRSRRGRGRAEEPVCASSSRSALRSPAIFAHA